MRWLSILALLAACAPSPLYARASERLGVHGKHLHLDGYDRMGSSDVYVFCRRESSNAIGGGRTYDGACVVYVCPAGDDGRRCD